jgi:hypothetical protein
MTAKWLIYPIMVFSPPAFIHYQTLEGEIELYSLSRKQITFHEMQLQFMAMNKKYPIC